MEKHIRNIVKNFKYIAFDKEPPKLMRVQSKSLENLPESNLLIKVKAIGINRAETLQRQGKYPLKQGDEDLLGLEAAGEVYDPQTGNKLFDGMALINGGSYAEYVSVPKSHIMKIPNQLSFVEAAAIPQVWITAFQLLSIAKIQPKDKVLIYAGASGVGTAAIQLCQYFKAFPFPLTSSEQKIAVCESLGAKGYSYKKQNWEQDLLDATGGKGFDIILDCVGASFSNSTIKLLGEDSRWVVFGAMGGTKVEIDLGKLLRLRSNIHFTTLKSRSEEYKTDLIQKFSSQIVVGFDNKSLKPVIGKIIDHRWQDDKADAFIQAHQIMEDNLTQGKVIIRYI